MAGEGDHEDRSERGLDAAVAQLLHDLRTPLTAIVGFAQLTLDRLPAGHELAELVEPILRSGRDIEARLAALERCEAPTEPERSGR